LIVVSTRGFSGFSCWLLGSVTDRVFRGTTVPLLLVRCGQDSGPYHDQQR
jgi:nucleotide-binding universal stress UspA family protein